MGVGYHILSSECVQSVIVQLSNRASYLGLFVTANNLEKATNEGKVMSQSKFLAVWLGDLSQST